MTATTEARTKTGWVWSNGMFWPPFPGWRATSVTGTPESEHRPRYEVCCETCRGSGVTEYGWCKSCKDCKGLGKRISYTPPAGPDALNEAIGRNS